MCLLVSHTQQQAQVCVPPSLFSYQAAGFIVKLRHHLNASSVVRRKWKRTGTTTWLGIKHKLKPWTEMEDSATPKTPTGKLIWQQRTYNSYTPGTVLDAHLRVEVDHGCRLYVLLPKHLHLHSCVGELVGKVVQEVWEVGRCSVDDSHHKAGSLGLVLAEGQSHKLLGEALHLLRRQTGELVAVGVRHRRPSVGLLLHVDQVAKLQARQARHGGAVERRAVAEPVPDHGGDGGRILVLVLEQVAAVHVVVPVDPLEERGQGHRHPRTHRLTGAMIHFGATVPLLHPLPIFVLLFLLLFQLLQQEVFIQTGFGLLCGLCWSEKFLLPSEQDCEASKWVTLGHSVAEILKTWTCVYRCYIRV